MSGSGQTFIVRVIETGSASSGRGVVERVGSGDSTTFTSGHQLLDIVFGPGGAGGDVKSQLDE